MGSDLFAPWHIIILVVVLLLLFGAKRLPGAAQSLGQSMHIFKKSMRGLTDEDQQAGGATASQATFVPPAPQPPAPPPAPPQLPGQVNDQVRQSQISDLQRQIEELQRASAGGNGTGASGTQAAEPQRNQQSY